MIIHKLKIVSVLFLIMIALHQRIHAQQSAKIVSECTITYNVNIAGAERKEATVKKLYIKGRKTRSEIRSSSFYQATIFDNKTGDAVLLKEIGADKYISSFSAQQWKDKNSQWTSVSVKMTGETKAILNYTCRKAITTMKDGSTFVVYFTTEMSASATENPYQFKDIPGLILEYESQTGNGENIEFKATRIDFNPVPAAKFTVPTSGYRVINN